MPSCQQEKQSVEIRVNSMAYGFVEEQHYRWYEQYSRCPRTVQYYWCSPRVSAASCSYTGAWCYCRHAESEDAERCTIRVNNSYGTLGSASISSLSTVVAKTNPWLDGLTRLQRAACCRMCWNPHPPATTPPRDWVRTFKHDNVAKASLLVIV